MKLLFDQNLSHKLVAALGDVFPGSSHVRFNGLDRADDVAVWDYAAAHDFCIVTLDTDFADLSAVRGSPPKVLQLRCGNKPTAFVEGLLLGQALRVISLAAMDGVDLIEIG